MWVFPPPVWCTTMSELGRCGCSRQKNASSCPRHIIGTPQTEADAATMQSFNCASSTLDSATAYSLSTMLQLSIKSSFTTVVGLRSIRSNAASSAPALARWLEDALGNSGGVHLATWWCFEFFSLRHQSFWGAERMGKIERRAKSSMSGRKWN